MFAKACAGFEPTVLCSQVTIWPALTETAVSVTGLQASGCVCLDTPVFIADQCWLMFSFHGSVGCDYVCTTLRPPESLEGLCCKGRAMLAETLWSFRSINKSLLWMMWAILMAFIPA